jgi:N utilization substance protein A
MTVIKSEFFLALNQVATERGISPEDVVESIKMAVLAAYKKDFHPDEVIEEGAEERFRIDINQDSGETRIFEGDKDITPPGFGRIAAQTARQVILQKIREAEKKTIIQHYVSQVGTLAKGRVIRYDGKNAFFDIGKAEALLPYEEQIRGEQYRPNDSFIVYIKEIRDDNFGNSRVIISRSAPQLVEELFKKEVPEVANGTVKIKNVVREPGERAKIAVYSDQTGVDPVGACVGQKGMRVKAVTDELGGNEKIDIIQWNNDDIFFIREALSPAEIESVEINREEKRAIVKVSESQAPLAIGRSGTNVNLASKLTQYTIDIVQTPAANSEEKTEDQPVENAEAVS